MKCLKSTAHTRYDLRYHFVFLPHYRKRVLTGKVARSIEGMIRFASQINDWEIYELAVMQDHVHLYLGASPKWSPSQIMKIVKGGTSKKITKMYPNLDEIYWGSNFWAVGYMVKSVGEATDKVISDYVRKQKGEILTKTTDF
ncbi:MAG: IS200/IS605 family transposase [Candidatus Microgenomates bacterium]